MSRSPQPHYHIGLRTIKTGLAVVLALLLDSSFPSVSPFESALQSRLPVSYLSRSVCMTRREAHRLPMPSAVFWIPQLGLLWALLSMQSSSPITTIA